MGKPGSISFSNSLVDMDLEGELHRAQKWAEVEELGGEGSTRAEARWGECKPLFFKVTGYVKLTLSPCHSQSKSHSETTFCAFNGGPKVVPIRINFGPNFQ